MRLNNEEKLKLVLENLEKGVHFLEVTKWYEYHISNLKCFGGLDRIH
jgi:hypothetical protein